MKTLQKLNASILIVASEITPLAKVGGLGDVIGALPKALNKYVTNVAVAVPFHEVIHQQHLAKLVLFKKFTLPFCDDEAEITVWKSVVPHSNVPLFLFDNPLYLSQGEIYSSAKTWHPLHHRWSGRANSVVIRYAFFSQAVATFIQGFPRQFTVVHLNDWLTAPIALLLQQNDVSVRPKTVFTVHNPGHNLGLTASTLRLYPPTVQQALLRDPVSYHRHNPLTRLGIQYSSLVNVVSPEYRKELLTPRYGRELVRVLHERDKDFFGILNGIDTNLFNPQSDPVLLQRFSKYQLSRRLRNKVHLQRICGFKKNPTVPLLGVVSRIESQKGFGLLWRLIPQLSHVGAQCLVTGTGNKLYEEKLKRLAKKFPDHFVFHNSFDVSFAHQIYGGADIFLMPSLYEPCGLAQLIAMRYGCVPIVRAIGGLKDTVIDGYSGFTFQAYSHQAFIHAVRKALAMYRTQPTAWKKLMINGMSADYSWDRSAQEYTALYRKLLKSAA